MKGLFIRCHSFSLAMLSLLSDLYSFHQDDECARRTYDEVCSAYERIFQKLELKCYKGTTPIARLFSSIFGIFVSIGRQWSNGRID